MSEDTISHDKMQARLDSLSDQIEGGLRNDTRPLEVGKEFHPVDDNTILRAGETPKRKVQQVLAGNPATRLYRPSYRNIPAEFPSQKANKGNEEAAVPVPNRVEEVVVQEVLNPISTSEMVPVMVGGGTPQAVKEMPRPAFDRHGAPVGDTNPTRPLDPNRVPNESPIRAVDAPPVEEF